MNTKIFTFIFVMWILILIGGGILIKLTAPISINCCGNLDLLVTSGIKAVIAILLVIAWIYILSKTKNRIFQKQIVS